MRAAVAVILSGLFGAADQYIGSLPTHPWMTDVSLLSAPWLVLPFVAGSTQKGPWRAALLGLACTFSALAGYCLMTLSPVENAHLTSAAVAGFVRSQTNVILGGLLTGPVFGWFGQQWRCRGAWWPPLLTAAALCLEPLAHQLAGDPIASSSVLVAEIAAGAAVAVSLGAAQRRRRPWGGPTRPG